MIIFFPTQAAPLADPAVKVRDATSAIVWLQHCQRYSIDEHIEACELKVGQSFLRLAAEQKEALALLSSLTLIRISGAYARCSRASNSATVQAQCDYCCRSITINHNERCTPPSAHAMDAEVASTLVNFFK